MTALSAWPRDSSNKSERRRCKIRGHVRAGSTGEFESSRDVRPTILIAAEDSLDPAQGYQRGGGGGGG
jgi:hypothetical protein